MLTLPPPNASIDLPRANYRRVGPLPRWRRYLNCIRHPIHAFMAYQVVNPDPVTEREKAMGLAAVIHGAVAWFLLTHS
jgi:hypothetical protein